MHNLAIISINKKFTLNSKFVSRRGIEILVRPAGPADVLGVTELIHDAFEVWKRRGLKLNPMFQTEEQTARHLLESGFVAVTSSGEMVGTFSLDHGVVEPPRAGFLHFLEGSDPEIAFVCENNSIGKIPDKLLVFKKAAVKQQWASSGVGTTLYQLAEDFARDNGFGGMVLETTRETDWLFNWYVRLGFTPVGSHRYPKSDLDTVLLIKSF